MADILHDFPIAVPPDRVFEAVTSPAGLAQWWTLSGAGEPKLGATYLFHFGDGYDWRGVVRRVESGRAIEWEIIEADEDWTGTRVSFELAPEGAGTRVRFAHTGWQNANAHFRTSSFCWAMYLRIMKRFVESGETVRFGARLSA